MTGQFRTRGRDRYNNGARQILRCRIKRRSLRSDSSIFTGPHNQNLGMVQIKMDANRKLMPKEATNAADPAIQDKAIKPYHNLSPQHSSAGAITKQKTKNAAADPESAAPPAVMDITDSDRGCDSQHKFVPSNNIKQKEENGVTILKHKKTKHDSQSKRHTYMEEIATISKMENDSYAKSARLQQLIMRIQQKRAARAKAAESAASAADFAATGDGARGAAPAARPSKDPSYVTGLRSANEKTRQRLDTNAAIKQTEDAIDKQEAIIEKMQQS